MSDMNALGFRSGDMCSIFSSSYITGRLNFISPDDVIPPFGRYALISITFYLLSFVHLFLVQDIYSFPNKR